MHWWFVMGNTANKCIYRPVNLLHYKQLGLLHVSSTYCVHLQGGVLWRIYYAEHQNNLIYTHTHIYKYYILHTSLKSMLKYKILIKSLCWFACYAVHMVTQSKWRWTHHHHHLRRVIGWVVADLSKDLVRVIFRVHRVISPYIDFPGSLRQRDSPKRRINAPSDTASHIKRF